MAGMMKTGDVKKAMAKKKTSIGNGNVKMSSMNKHKKRTFKAYRGQGK
jgi:hypothetical protein